MDFYDWRHFCSFGHVFSFDRDRGICPRAYGEMITNKRNKKRRRFK